MLREIDLAEVSDGKLYTARDMVKAGCDDCRGCCDCCKGMGKSVVLDPYDVFRLEEGLGQSFQELLTYALELNVVDGVILPNLKMTGDGERCSFLNPEGRCSIHPYRPGFCRMFPLGRIYEERGFHYFLQVHECPKQPKTKVKVSKWLDTPELKKYEAYVLSWHNFLKKAGKILGQFQNPEEAKNVSMYILKNFFLVPWDFTEDFYGQFEEKLKAGEKYFF